MSDATPAHRIYRSQIDNWLWVLLSGCSLLTICASLPLLQHSLWLLPLALFILILGAGLPLWMLLSTHYTLTQSHLLITCAFFHWKIPLADITQVSPSRSVISSPALSLNRLAVRYGRYNEVLISPRNPHEFLQALVHLGVKTTAFNS